MKIWFSNILLILFSLFFLSVANGFIVEEYFCAGCKEEHTELKFFEFGEILHNHSPCSNCLENGNKCVCHHDDHLNNFSIKYFSLNNLFFSLQKVSFTSKIVKIVTTAVFDSFSFLSSKISLNLNNYLFKIKLLKIPIFGFKDFNGNSFNSFVCTFLF